jgi:hypothetical protein
LSKNSGCVGSSRIAVVASSSAFWVRPILPQAALRLVKVRGRFGSMRIASSKSAIAFWYSPLKYQAAPRSENACAKSGLSRSA